MVYRRVVTWLALCASLAGVAEAAPSLTLRRSDRVVVVGGGPAGVHYATLLAKKGVANVTLIEASTEVGGKSQTRWDDRGLPQEMGTVFALDSYTPIFNLAQEYDPTNARFVFGFEQPGYMATMGESVGAKDYDPKTSMDYPSYLLHSIQQVAPPHLQPTATKAQLQELFLDQAMRFIALHKSIFGTYAYGVPPQPKDWSDIDMTAMEFIERHNLTALIGMFKFSQQQQGYGVLETIPAFYFLWWSHPTAIAKILRAQVSGTPCAYEFTKGFQSIWTSMIRAHTQNIKTILNARVTAVSRGLSTTRNASKPFVTYTTNYGRSETIECDHVVMAIDLSQFVDVVVDLTPAERAVFVGSYTASTFVTSLYESRPAPAETAAQVWLDRMNNDGRLSSLRNTRLTFASFRNGVNASTNWGGLIQNRQVRIAYQFYDQPLARVDRGQSRSQLVTDLGLAGMGEVSLWTQAHFNYFPRFTPAGLKNGLPWKILDMQFDTNTTWIGSSVCFESALDVVTYNINLMQRVQVVA